VLIEAMACGKPVIAFNRGSVPEIVEDGLTGFVVEDEEEAVAATDGLSRLSRGAIRQRFEARFTARRMAREYLVVYRSAIEPVLLIAWYIVTRAHTYNQCRDAFRAHG
jgi:glycosyltransferase involved in cell wall biosynthesis